MTGGVDYSPNPRVEFQHILPRTCARVLDVGCSKGGFAATLRRQYGASAYLAGAEPVAADAEQARTAGFDEVFEGFFPEDLPSHARDFDLITFWDVLEHFEDPWTKLRECHDLLAPGGVVAASIPNITYLPALRDIVVRGRFPYTDEGGIFDITHLRFFTRSSVHDLFESTGYEVVRCDGAYDVLQLGRYRVLKPVGRIVGDRRWMNFLVLARPR